MTPLQYAAQQGNVQAVRLLLDTNVCAHLKNITENTSILLAARAGHWECVDLFIETKENIPSYWRVLPRAAKANNFDIVKKLLKEIKGKNNLSGYLISEKMTALHYAVKNDNEEMVHMLLDTGANLNSRDKEGNTPLHIAAQYGNTKIVHVLLTRGANPCGVNNKDMRPIQLASVGGQWECVKVFIQAGRNTSNYESILLYAAWKNQRDVVLMLLQQDDFFEVDLPFSDTRETALHYAARDGHTEIVQLLLEKGASSNCRDYQGRMAVHNAAERGHAEIVQLLLNASFREMEGEDTAIALAARNHHWDCVRMFIEEKRGGGQYGVILLYAAEADRLDVVEALLHVSSNLGIKYGVKHRGRTTLHYAAQHGDVKMVSLFLERGADPHWKDRDKNRPIDLALERGHWECVEKLAQFVHKNKHAETISALIQTGKNLENNPRKFKIYISLIRYFVRNSWGDSWTSQPTSERRLENIKALLKILENSEEADFLQNIRQYCDTKIKTSSISTRSALRTDVLEAVSVCADIDLLSAAEANQLDIVEKLLDINNGIHFRKIGGITALHCAAKNGNAKMVEALLRAGANPTLEDNGGNKPLILAARKDHWDCVGIFLRMKKYSSDEDLVLWYAAQANNLEIVRMIGLLKRQGMVSGRDKATQKTALHFAAQHGNAEMVRELSPTYHDDLHWFDKNGHTPLHIAGENNRAEVVDILLKAGASPRLKDRNGYMPIQLAIERGHWECVEKLARFMHGDKHRHIIDTFIRIGRNLENNENDKKLRTYNAVINYFIGDPLSVSWTSQPTSDRRLEDIKALLEMIEKDEDNPEDDFEEGVRQYCATQIKTSHRFGFFNRSALRDSVLEACSSASSSPLGMRRGAGAAAA
jgi:cytohesin